MRVVVTRDIDVERPRLYSESFRAGVIYWNVAPAVAAAIVREQAGRILDDEQDNAEANVLE